MKKGLAIALGTVVFAMVSVTGFAKSPVIEGVPDVIIGDCEDSLTVDHNWFRYLNAFNILDYTTDEDTTVTELVQFVFVEENSFNDIQINDSLQVPVGSEANPGAWGPYELTNFGSTPRNFLFSFLDLVRSDPAAKNADPPWWDNPVDALGAEVTSDSLQWLPFHDEAGDLVGGGPADNPANASGRTVFLHAADDFDNIGTDTILVMSLNAGCDALSGAINTIFTTDFSDGAGTLWTYLNGAPNIPVATSGEQTGVDGYLSLEAGLVATGGLTGVGYDDKYFGRWITYNSASGGFEGVHESVEGNVIYYALFNLQHDNANPNLAPRLRLGANQAVGGIITDMYVDGLTVDSDTDPKWNPQTPPQNTPRDYYVLWSKNETSDYDDLLWDTTDPPDGVPEYDLRTWNCYFDVLDLKDLESGVWQMNYQEVGTIMRPSNTTPVDSFTDLETTGWTVAGSTTSNPITVTFDSGVPTFNDPGVPAGTAGPDANFYLWQKDPLDNAKWTAGKTLRTTVELSVPDQSARDNFHRFRVRNFTTYHLFQDFVVASDNGGALTSVNMAGFPPVAPATQKYETYLHSFGGPSADLQGLGADAFGVALDQLHNAIDPGFNGATSDQATATTVHSVALELINDPNLPSAP